MLKKFIVKGADLLFLTSFPNGKLVRCKILDVSGNRIRISTNSGKSTDWTKEDFIFQRSNDFFHITRERMECFLTSVRGQYIKKSSPAWAYISRSFGFGSGNSKKVLKRLNLDPERTEGYR